jgi:hypothetical protein
MGSSYKEEGYIKDKAFMERVIIPFHALYADLTLEMNAVFLRQAFRGHFNIELLFEETLSHINPRLVRTSSPYMDYKDGTDAKCIGMLLKYQRRPDGIRKTIRGTVSNVSRKSKGIRLAVYNEFVKRIDYFLIPSKAIARLVGGKKSIHFQYSHTKDRYTNGMDEFRVLTIMDVAFGKIR